jgi:hypothetical protein
MYILLNSKGMKIVEVKGVRKERKRRKKLRKLGKENWEKGAGREVVERVRNGRA